MITAKEHLENTSHMDWLTISQKLLVEAFMESYYELRKEQEIKKECAMDIMKTGALGWSRELRDRGVIETIIEFVGNAGSNKDLQSVRYWLYSYLESTYSGGNES